ncbi:MAG: hypothetical protein N2645_01730 [Clostridia bacterium]|nr:hypothetical protein [Clostridia bacterium]
MNAVKRVYKWIILSVVLQLIALGYMNHYFSFKEAEVVATSYEVDTKLENDTSIKIPENVETAKTSFSSSYVAYIHEGKLEIVDLKKKKNIETISHEEGSVSFYKWLPDRDIIIYSLKFNNDNAGGVQIYTYDISSKVTSDYPKIKNLSTKSDVLDIQLSPLTNIVYAKIKVSDQEASIYKFNIMENIDYIMNVPLNTNIRETIYSDKLIYQGGKNKITVRDGLKSSSKTLPFEGKMVLLGVDNEDQVYAGELDDNKKVSKIYYGKLDEDIDETWKKVPLKTPVIPEKIHITSGGLIYENHETGPSIYNLLSGKRIEFRGSLIEVLDQCIVSLEDRKLKFQVVRETE